MPISKYDRYFGGDAAKAYAAMRKQYGSEKGRRVFYALVNRKKKAKPDERERPSDLRTGEERAEGPAEVRKLRGRR